MDKKWIPLLAVILSVLACVVSGVAFLGRQRVPVVTAASQEPGAGELQELSRQVASLRAEIERPAGAKLESPEPHAAREPAGASATPSPEVLQRLTSLEESVAILQRQAKERSAAVQAAASTARDPKDAKLVATDPRATEQERLAALKDLRGQKLDGQDARSHDVVLAMVGVAEQSTDENMRVDMYRNLHGSTDQALRDSMLRALANDPSAKVRTKVAQDINTFLSDGLVVSALRQAADHDPDQGVRDQASKTLASAH